MEIASPLLEALKHVPISSPLPPSSFFSPVPIEFSSAPSPPPNVEIPTSQTPPSPSNSSNRPEQDPEDMKPEVRDLTKLYKSLSYQLDDLRKRRRQLRLLERIAIKEFYECEDCSRVPLRPPSLHGGSRLNPDFERLKREKEKREKRGKLFTNSNGVWCKCG